MTSLLNHANKAAALKRSDIPHTRLPVVKLLLLRLAIVYLLLSGSVTASDHADPIDPLYWKRQESAITDLFVFPVLKTDQGSPATTNQAKNTYLDAVAFPFERTANLPLHDLTADIFREPLTAEQRDQIDSLVVIVCVRRQLTDSRMLRLDPYEYRVHIDLDSAVRFPETNEDGSTQATSPPPGSHSERLSDLEAYARYGGRVIAPGEINEDAIIAIRLNDQANLAEDGLQFRKTVGATWDSKSITVSTGVFEDPFIFPQFFGTNIVAIALKIPMECFPSKQDALLVWATSHKGKKQIDHVGRSARTQNPRFNFLNKLHPSRHKAAIEHQHDNPSAVRDILLRANLSSLFAFRYWDFEPDVMIYSPDHPVGFPNGRLLTDDVAAILAQQGDTLLYELSFQDNQGSWPRQQSNDTNQGQFGFTFPYLNPPFPDRAQPKLRRLSGRTIAVLISIGIILVALLAFENWVVVKLYKRWRQKKNYL